MESNWFDTFHGQHVTVLTQAGNEEKSDTGTLVHANDGWMQLVKDNGEMVLIPSTAIRLVKLLDMAQRTAAVERQLESQYPSRTYIDSDTAARNQAPDEKAVI